MGFLVRNLGDRTALKGDGRDYNAVGEDLSFGGGRGAVYWKVTEQRLEGMDRTSMGHCQGSSYVYRPLDRNTVKEGVL